MCHRRICTCATGCRTIFTTQRCSLSGSPKSWTCGEELTTRTQHTYIRLAETLIAAHHDLERSRRLTLDSFAELHADARREQTERLTRLADAEAGAATHVGPAAMARIHKALGGAVTEAEIEVALSRSGVRIVREFPDLPTAPHPKYANLSQYLRQLDRALSAAVVFGDAGTQRLPGAQRFPADGWAAAG